MVHSPQCPCCAGTDVAHRLGEPCYAEWLQAQWDEERRAQEEYEQARYEEAMREEEPSPLPLGGAAEAEEADPLDVVPF